MFALFTAALLAALVSGLGNDLHNQIQVVCEARNQHEFAELVLLVDKMEADLWEESPKQFPSMLPIRIHKSQWSAFKARFHCPSAAPLYIPPPPSKKDFALLTDFFADYRSFADQEAFLKQLVGNHSALAKSEVIGRSLEGRPLYILHLSSNFAAKKKAVWVNGGQHAREWLASAACLYLLRDALTNPHKLLNKFDLLIAPNLNPDGYEQSRNVNRYWRKNMRRNRDGSMGVDLNRNWNNKWNQINGGGAPNSEVYPGTGPASEPEVAVTAAYIYANRSKIMAGVDVHTYGEVVLRNYGWTTKPCPDEPRFKRYGDAMAKAAQQVAKEHYSSELSAGLYPTSGSLDDWFYMKAGFPGFTFEMRDDGTFGFVTPSSYIVPNGQELVQAILALINLL